MDAKAGYWSIHLDEASQEITTFRTPFGRYCRYGRLPFGLCVSQDLFQQAMDRILARAPGCVGIADDVVVYGRDYTEHDKNLLRLMQVAKEEGLVFNSKKCVIKTSEIVFFGSVYGKDDIMLEVDDENACSIDLINFSINKRMQLREMFTADHTLSENIHNEATEHTRRRVTFRGHNTDEQQVATPVTTTGEPPPDEATSLAPAIRRSGRIIRKPSRFQE